jgi:hypothetical protein
MLLDFIVSVPSIHENIVVRALMQSDVPKE